MAQKKSKSRFKKNNLKKPNAKWINNAMKSIGEVSLNAFKEMAPTITTTASGITSTAKELRVFARNKQTQNVLKDNKYIKVAKNVVNYALEDIKSGNFNNEARSEEAFMKSMGLNADDYNFDDFNDDDDEASVSFNYIDEGESTNSKASLEIRESINRSTESNLKASQATIDAMVSIAGTSLLHSQQIGNEVISHLSNIENTVTSMLEYQQQNTTNFYEATLAFMEKIGNESEEDDYKDNSVKGSDVIDSNGGINIGVYKKYVKQQLKDYAGNAAGGAGQVLSMLTQNDNMIEAMLSNPLGSAGKLIIQSITPSLIKGTIQNVEETFKDFMPTMLSKLRNWKNNEEMGFIGTIKRALGNVFGIDLDKTNSFDLSGKVTKEKATFDGVVRNSLVEVIPKYLRESTAYLKAIAEHYKINTNKVLNNAEVYDVESNSYKKRGDIRKDLAQRINDSQVSEIGYSNFGKTIKSGGSSLSEKDSESYEKLYQQLFSLIGRNNHNLSPEDIDLDNKSSEFSKMLAKLDVKGKHDKRAYDVLANTLRIMRSENLNTASLARAQIAAKKSFANTVRQISDDYDMENLLAAGISENTNLSDFIDSELGYTKVKKLNRQREKARKKQEKKENRQAERESYAPSYVFKSGSDLAREGLLSRNIIANTDTRRGRERYQLQNAEANGIFTSFANAGNHVKASMYALMNGDSKDAVREIGQIFGDSMKGLWKSFKNNFISPITKTFFGEKNDDGFREGGLLAGSQNKIKDAWHSINMRITGKAYKDSSGKLHTKESDGVTSSVDIVKNTMKDIGESIRYRLFGDKDKDKDSEDGKKKKGVVSNLVSSLKEGLNGWRTALFGKDEKETEKAVEDIKKKAMDAIPDAGASAIAGAVVGGVAGTSLLGTLIGGPVGGAVIGFGSSFLRRSKSFQDYVFGPEVTDENGKKHRVGGLISRSTQEMFKDPAIKKSVVGGAAIGVIKNLALGSSGGVMGMLVGGPIAGAAIGAGIGLIRKSEMFHTFLYGDEEKGKTGLIQHFKNVFKRDKSKNTKDEDSLSKKLGMGAIGAAGGFLTASLVGQVGLLGAMLTPAGPVGGAILGLAVGMKASSKKFVRTLFGEKDEETGKRKGGLVQKVANFMHVEILEPMKGLFQNVADDIKATIQYKILDTIRISVAPIGEAIKSTVGKITDAAKSVINDTGKAIKDNLIKPFLTVVSNVLAPVRKAGALVAKIATKTAKTIVTFPFRMMRMAANIITSPFRKMASAVNRYFVKPLIKKGKKLIGGLFKKVFGIISTPFKVLAAVTSFARQKGGDKFAKLGRTLGIGNYSDNGTYRSERRRSDREYRDQKRINRQKARERRNLDVNRRRMAKVLGYDEKYFTKDNMRRAQDIWRAQGHKKALKFVGGKDITFDKDPEQLAREEQKAADKKREKILKKSNAELVHGDGAADGADVDVRNLRENSKQTLLLDAIVNLLGGESPLGRWSPFKKKQDDQQRAREQLNRNREAANNEEAHEAEPDSENIESNLSDYQRWTEEMLEAGGIGKWAKNKIKNKFGRRRGNRESSASSAFAEFLDSDGVDNLDSVNNIVDDFIQNISNSDEESETPRERETLGSKVKNFFGKFGRRRAKGGPVEEGKAYLVGDGGTDSSAMEIFNPRSNGRILSQGESGLKVFVEGISSKAVSKLKDFFGSKKRKKKKSKDEVSDNTEEANEDTSASLEFKSTGRTIGDLSQYDKATQKSILRNMKKRGVDTDSLIDHDAIAIAKSIRRHNDKEAKRKASFDRDEQNKKGSYAVTHAAKEAAAKEAERDATLKDIATNTRESADTSKKSLKEWLKTFGKGGLIAVAITALLPVIKSIWNTIGSGILDQAKQLIEDIKFGIQNLKDGLSPLGVIAGKIKKIVRVITHPTEIFENLKDLFLGDDGKTDNETGSKVNYARTKVQKGAHTVKKVKAGYVAFRDAVSGGKYSAKKAEQKLAKEAAKEAAKNGGAKKAQWAAKVTKNAEGKGLKNGVKRFFTKHGPKNVKQAILNGKINAVSGGDELTKKQIQKSIARHNAKVEANAAKDAVKGATKSGKVKAYVGKGVEALKAKVLKNSTGAAVEGANKGLASKCISWFKTGISKIIEKLSEIATKYSAKKGAKQAAKNAFNKNFKTVLSKATTIISKKFPTISAKVAALFASDGVIATATAGIGLVVKKLGFVGLYAANEASNPRNLFHLDSSTEPDALMYAIAAALGGFKGTNTGAIMDLCSALIASTIGVDIFHELACLAYKILMGLSADESTANMKINEMKKSQNKLKRKYKVYKEKEDTKQFEQYNKLRTMTGKKELTYQQYQKKVSEGKIKPAKVDSFADFNHKQNKTVGTKVADKLLTIGGGIKKKLDKFWGKNITGYYDEDNNIFYVPKSDNVYRIYAAKSSKASMDENLSSMNNFVYKGDIQAGNIPNFKKLKKVEIKNKGAKLVVQAIGKSVGDTVTLAGKTLSTVGKTVVGAAKSVPKVFGQAIDAVGKGEKFVADKLGQGGKFIANAVGKGFNTVKNSKFGNVVGTGFSQIGNGVKDITQGHVLSGIGKIAKTPLYYGAEAIGAVANQARKGVEAIGKGVWKAGSAVVDGVGKAGNAVKNFFTSEKEEIFRNPKKNTYWKFDHKTSQYVEYNMNGDRTINLSLTANKIYEMHREGKLVRDTLTTRESGISKLKDKFLKGVSDAGAAIKDSFNASVKAVTNFGNSIKKGAIDIANSAKDKVVDTAKKVGDYFKEKTTIYQKVGETGYYDYKGRYYNINGDRIEANDVTQDKLAKMLHDSKVTPIKQTKLQAASNLVRRTWSNFNLQRKKALKFVGNKFVQAGKDFKKFVSNTAKGIGNFAKSKVTDIKNYFKKRTTIYVVVGGNGEYYDYKGRYYNANGDRIETGDVTQKKLAEMHHNNEVTATEQKGTAAIGGIATRTWKNITSTLKTSFTNMKNATAKAYRNVKATFDKAATAVVKFGENLVKNGIGAIHKLTKKKKKAYYIPDGGGYYVENDDGTFNRYNLANDLIEENIKGKDADEIRDNIAKSFYKEGEITENRELKDIVGSLKDKVTKGWKSAMDTVSSKWKKLTSWLSNGAGDVNLPDTSSGGNGIGGNGNVSKRANFNNPNEIGGAGNQVNNFPYYSQKDSRWANSDYSSGSNKGNMGEAGCGPTAMAMVATKYAGGNDTSPMAMARDAKRAGYRDGTGTNANFMSYEAKKLNLNSNEKMNPDASYISSNVGNGKSIILNGISNGEEGSAFTKAGHYVVAVGKDANGNILINDPRGEEYSRAISPKKLAKQTRMGWSFSKNSSKTGGAGIVQRIREKIGGTGQDWIGCVRSVHKAMSSEGRKHGYSYSQQSWHDIKVNGKTYKVRWDCSGYVSVCLQVYGVKPKGWVTDSRGFVSKGCNISKFKYMPWPGWDKLQEGDIMARDGHVEIFAYNKGGAHYVYNAGYTEAINATKPTRTSHLQGYTTVWRPNNPGKGVELNTSNASSDNNSSSSTAASTDSSSNDVLSRVSDVFSQYATKATNGMLTGKWDYNFDTPDASADSNSSSDSSSSDDSSSIKGNIKLNGNGNVEKVWNFFTSKGFSPAATAGILGNMYQESGVNPKALQNGRGPAAGIFQWENYNTKESRFGNLYRRAKKAGKSWTDLGIQLGYALDEIKTADISNRMSGKYGKISKGGTTMTDIDGRSYVVNPVNGFDGYKKMTNATEATKTFEAAFERASKPNFKRRIEFAKSVMNKYGGKGGDDETPYYKKELVGGSGTQENESKVTNIKHVDSTSSAISNELKQREVHSRVTKITDNSNIEQLLTKVYEVLESIDTNTANAGTALKNLKQTTVNTQNIVTNGSSEHKTITASKSSKFQSSMSGRNAALAERIARG